MSVFQALTLMLMFGTFVLTLLDYIKKPSHIITLDELWDDFRFS
ncbi:putative holin-like toxin [Limosilactobacillus fermentum]